MTDPRVLCFGDALVDLMSEQPEAELPDVRSFRLCPGGSALNTAVVAARLGCPTGLCSAVGDDPFGLFLRRTLAGEGVDAAAVWSRPGCSTGVAFASSPGGRPSFHIVRGRQAPASTLGAAEVPERALDRCAAFHLSSLFAYAYAPASFVAACVDRARAAGALVSFDPNVRRHAFLEHEEALGRALALVDRADLVKMSDEDASFLFPGVSPELVARGLVERGARLAAVTCGAEGAVVAHRRGKACAVHPVPAFPVRVVDTVGAGDAWMGGLLAGLEERGLLALDALSEPSPAEVVAAARLGAAAAAAVCGGRGALSGLEGRRQADRLLATASGRRPRR